MKNPFPSTFCAIFVLLFCSVAFTQEQKNDLQVAPIMDYQIEVQKLNSNQLKRKHKHLKTGLTIGGREIVELPEGVEPLPLINHWWLRMPALPISQSNAVIIGKVTDAEAHLTDDRRGIYSEFSLRVEQIFKDTTKSVNLNLDLSVYRFGGSVRFSSGRVNTYTIHRQGMPQKDNRYIFFLNQTEGGDFLILTGYEITNNRIDPLDGQDNLDPNGALTFAQYNGVDESVFLKDLQTNLDLDKARK